MRFGRASGGHNPVNGGSVLIQKGALCYYKKECCLEFLRFGFSFLRSAPTSFVCCLAGFEALEGCRAAVSDILDRSVSCVFVCCIAIVTCCVASF